MGKWRILTVALLLFLLAGCSGKAEELDYAPEDGERLVLYTSHKKEVWWPIVKEFETRTGVWVEVVEAASPATGSRCGMTTPLP